MDFVLDGKFLMFGLDGITYLTTEDPTNSTNIFCDTFPTVLSCHVVFGNVVGFADQTNTICLLQSNLFNQKFFFLIYWLWLLLLAISILNLLVQITKWISPSFSR